MNEGQTEAIRQICGIMRELGSNERPEVAECVERCFRGALWPGCWLMPYPMEILPESKPEGFVELRSELCNVRANIAENAKQIDEQRDEIAALKKEIADTKADGEYLGRCSRGHRVELDVLKKNAEAVHADVKRRHVRPSVDFDMIQLMQKDISGSRDLIRVLIERVDKLESKATTEPSVEPIQIGDWLEYLWPTAIGPAPFLDCGWSTVHEVHLECQIPIVRGKVMSGGGTHRVVRYGPNGKTVICGGTPQ